ncbi:MAG: sodium-dependent transporter [Pseudomonadota bacterium]
MAAISGKAEHWGSRFGFLMAAVGSSVGLGNLWRFPFTAGENGGSAFVIIYLACVLLLGLPVLMAEYAIGRKGQRSAISGIRHIAETEGKSTMWTAMGWIGALTSLGIFSFYIVIAAWVFNFIPQAFTGDFQGFDAEASGNNFAETIDNKGVIIAFVAAFLALNVFIVARGVKSGIERAASILMPVFFLMLLGMVIFALIVGDAGAAASFLLSPDFSKVGFGTFLSAVGQAFFSIGVGSCLMITYGAYLKRDTDIPASSMLVASADTMVALIAGFAIFPIVFGFGLEPGAGGGLFFITMPVAFGQMGALGAIVGGLFFTLALFAAFTSSISLFEVGVSWLEDQPWISRAHGAMLLGGILFLCGIGYVYAGAWIDHIDFVTGSIGLPLGGILVALFAGWVLSLPSIRDELGGAAAWVRPLLQYLVPAALIFILVFGVMDKMQDQYGVALPPVLEGLLGPNG